MSSYIIAGSSEKEDTSECENMANLIRQYYPDISFKIVLKEQSQWEQYVEEVCRIYGFKQKSNPIIYTMDGSLIGDRNAFIQLAETRFGLVDPKLRQGPITPDVNKRIAKSELDQKLKLQRQKLTLTEKIEQNMLRLYVREIVHPTEGVYKSSSRIGLQDKVRSLYNKLNAYLNRIINEDSCSGLIFSQSYRNGLKFLYKFEDRLRPVKQLQETQFLEELIEKVEQETTVLQEVVEDGVKVIKPVPYFHEKYMTLEQYQIQQQNELAQQQKDRESNPSYRNSVHVDVEKRDNTQDPMISPKALQNIPPTIAENQNQEGEDEPTETRAFQENKEGEVQEPLPEQQEQLELDQAVSIQGGVQPSSNQEEFEVLEVASEDQPNRIDVGQLYVHTFRNGYVAFLHPFPLLDGQFIICKPEEDEILDFSCIRRGRVNSYKKSSYAKGPEGLYDNQIDIFKSVTLQDCEMVAKLINKSDAIMVLNVLPQDLQSFLPLSNGHYTGIFRHHAELAKNNRKLFKYLVEDRKQTNSKHLTPIEQFILDQQSSCVEISRQVYKMKQFSITHFIVFLGNIVTAEQLHEEIVKIISIYLDAEPNVALKMGFNLLVTKHLIFFVPTLHSYDTIDGFKLHLSAFTPMGFLNLPTGSQVTNYFELLQKTQVK